MTDRRYLGELATMSLGINHLGEKTYEVPVSCELQKHRGKEVAVGSMYASLEAKALFKLELGDPTSKCCGKAKRFLQIANQALRRVHETQRVLTRLWNTIPAPEFDLVDEAR